MNLVFGEVVEIMHEDGMRLGRIRVGGALRNASLDLIRDAACGDCVLLCDGVAISKVEEPASPTENAAPFTIH